MTAALAKPTGWRRVGRFATAAAAAAAILVVVAMLVYEPETSRKTGEVTPVRELADIPTEVLIRELETRIEGMEESIRPGMMVEILAGEFVAIEADSVLVKGGGGTTDVEIDALQDELDSIMLNPVKPWSFEGDV